MNRVARSYVDALGNERHVDDATVARFETLLAPGPRTFVRPTIVVREDEAPAIEVTLPALSWTETVHWELLMEDGSERDGDVPLRDAPVVHVDERESGTFDTRRVELGAPLPLGTHRLTVRAGGYAHGSSCIVAVPQRAVAVAGRTWGLSVQLYTLRSQRNLGIGDLADLRALCALAGERGASYVGINPLHAAFRNDPGSASPYAATSRRWLNWLYIAVDELPEAQHADVRALRDAPETQATVTALQAAEMVDYGGVAALKDALLRRCFDALAGARADAFAEWCREQGEPLVRFATYEKLIVHFGRDLKAWPATFLTPTSPDVAMFAAGEDAEVRYGMFLQWCAALQLAAVAADARTRGVRIYRDLAVGVDAAAADVWADAGAYVSDVSVGAPPDELNTLGQDWGLPPADPRALARDGYAELLALLLANCSDAGALRIDHAMSLARLFWIPRGAGARSGTYVEYPLDDLRGVVALASVRSGCAIVGEDLGTVPAGFREAMAATGVLSYRILFFERGADGAFLAPSAYPALALATSGTHDLATIPAWLAGDDITLRDGLGLLETPASDARAARDTERTRFFEALERDGALAPQHRDDVTAVVVAANRYLAAAPSAIMMAQLEDILGERAPVNVPGTSTEYPNWRRKLAVPLEALAAHPGLSLLCTTLAEIRPRTP